MDEELVIPDIVEPFTGWRYWHIESSARGKPRKETWRDTLAAAYSRGARDKIDIEYRTVLSGAYNVAWDTAVHQAKCQFGTGFNPAPHIDLNTYLIKEFGEIGDLTKDRSIDIASTADRLQEAQNLHRAHLANQVCTGRCGIYTRRTPAIMLDALISPFSLFVIGQCDVYGKTFTYTEGFRSEYCAIRKLYSLTYDSQTMKTLSKKYGVKVCSVAEFVVDVIEDPKLRALCLDEANAAYEDHKAVQESRWENRNDRIKKLSNFAFRREYVTGYMPNLKKAMDALVRKDSEI